MEKNENNKKNIKFVEFNNENLFELIYYGSPGQECFVTNINGDFYHYNEKLFVNEFDNYSCSSSLMNLYSQKHLGSGYEELFLPAVPANDIFCFPLSRVISCNNDNVNIINNNASNVSNIISNEVVNDNINNKDTSYTGARNQNSIIKQCLVKVSKETVLTNKQNRDFYLAFKSGIRSAIVPLNNKYYRLKGCGNNNEGFVTEKLKFRKTGEEIRGCQFKHTSIREVYMSDKINTILMNYGFEVANKPVGIYYYNDNDEISKNQLKELSIKSDKPRITKTCSVFEVLSEKRVGCHLMPGNEMLFTKIIIDYLQTINKSNNKKDSSNDISQYTNFTNNKSINSYSGFINLVKGMFVEERWERKPKTKTEKELQKEREYEEKIRLEDEIRRNEILAKGGKLEEEYKADRENIDAINAKCQKKLEINFSQPIKDFSFSYQFVNDVNLTTDMKISDLFGNNNTNTTSSYDTGIYTNINDKKHFTDFSELYNKCKLPDDDEAFHQSNSVFYTNKKSNINNDDNSSNTLTVINGNISNNNEILTYTNEIPNLRHENLHFSRFLFDEKNNDSHKELIFDFMIKRASCLINNTSDNDEHKAKIIEEIRNKTSAILNNNNNNSFLFISCLLYSRIGYEIGVIKRILQENDINWGTFEDLPFRFHCNAHTDNLVLIPFKIRKNKLKENLEREMNQINFDSNKNYSGKERIKKTSSKSTSSNVSKNKRIKFKSNSIYPNLLSVLDFDLSFFRENFISLSLDLPDKYGVNDNFLFDSYLNAERQHLEWELAGIENMEIFSYIKENLSDCLTQEERKILETDNFSLCFNLITSLLRDNSVLNYQDGYLLKEFKYQDLFEKYYNEISDLIDICLLASYDLKG